jgi:diadenosine tetraphosphate (Ap4A) HIT family hydrolase
MTDLAVAEREALMNVVFACEAALQEVMAPDKVNLASLGNVVPHLHWHVIPRFGDDPHFPNPVWGVRQRDSPRAAQPDLDARLAAAINRLLARAQEKG